MIGHPNGHVLQWLSRLVTVSVPTTCPHPHAPIVSFETESELVGEKDGTPLFKSAVNVIMTKFN